MKRNWLILLTIVLLMVSMNSLAFGQEKKPAEGMYFRLVTHGGDDPFWAVVQQGMLDAAKEFGCQVDIDLAGSDLALQQKRFAEAPRRSPQIRHRLPQTVEGKEVPRLIFRNKEAGFGLTGDVDFDRKPA